MKISELIGARVRDDAGDDVGVVIDVRLTQDGRPLAGPDRSLRVAGLVIGPRTTLVVRLGLTRPDRTGPAILTRPARRLARRHSYIEWSQVRTLDRDHIEFAGELHDLPDP